MEEQALILTANNAEEIALAPGVNNARALAIAGARVIEKIETAEDVESATRIMKELSALKKTMDAAHKEAKAPYYAITKKLDELKKEYNAGLDAEAGRLSAMLGEHQELERRKAEEARKAVEAEQRRIAEEAARLEQERVQQETEAFNNDGTTTGTLSEDLKYIRETAAEEIARVRVEAVAKAAPALAGAGTSVRRDWNIEVLDVHALYAANPALCKLEADVPAIKNWLKKGFACPAGIKATPKFTASVKSKAYSPAELADDNDY